MILQAVKCQIYDSINTIYQFMKPFSDNKMSIFEDYGAFKQLISIVHILLPETDNCPSWINRKERMPINSIDPDQMPHFASSDLCLHCLNTLGIFGTQTLCSFFHKKGNHMSLIVRKCSKNWWPYLSVQTDQNCCHLPEDSSHPALTNEHPAKIIIRLCACAGWSETSLVCVYERPLAQKEGNLTFTHVFSAL